MKKLLLTALILVCTASLAAADRGVNAGGALVIHGSAEGLTFCGDAQNAELPGACEDFVTRIDRSGGPFANTFSWMLVAVFPEGSSPELRAAVFGIEWTGLSGNPTVINCGDFMIGTGDWPASGSGVGMTWDYAEYGLITPVMQFEGYNYGGNQGYFTIIDHPSQGAPVFGDDSIPTQEDPVEYIGVLGFFQDGELNCPPAGADPEGACCFEDGSCLYVTEADCAGVWLGEGTVCDPNPCPPPFGACCLSLGDCVYTQEETCPHEWLGAGTVCDPNPCPQPMGACCFEDGSCLYVTEAECAGDWLGMGTVCDPNPCPQPMGACCFEDGSCEYVVEADCPTGDWRMFVTCDPNPCDQPTGACCFPDGSCEVLTELDCQGAGGDWLGTGYACDPNPCPQPLGACCFEDGSCETLTFDECMAQGGSYWIPGRADPVDYCDPNPCEQPVGACCFEDGSCLYVTEAECQGDWLGMGTVCDPNPCPQPLGACCFEDGSCLYVTEAECQGDWLGMGTVCDPNPCPQPFGACCYEDGGCSSSAIRTRATSLSAHAASRTEAASF